MQITVESIGSVKKKINFEIPAERVATEMDRVYSDIAKKAAIKGFRKGKVPKALIEKQYSDVMEQDVIRNLVNDTYFKAVETEKLHPVSYPQIENEPLKKGDAFRYSATVEVFPELSVRDYKGLEVPKEIYGLKEEAVEAKLQEMREGLSQLQPAEAGRETEQGDFVTIDFSGTLEGVAFEGGTAEDFQLELGSGRFIPGFEDQLLGKKTGDRVAVTVTFPENYGNNELAGREAVFDVTIKEIKVKQLPELDDDFAKDAAECESLVQLRERITQDLEKQEKDRIEAEFKDRLIQKLIEKNDLELPDALVRQQLEQMLENTKKRLSYQRITMEMMGLDDNMYRQRFRPVAEGQVKGSLLLEAVAEKENIQVEEADLENRFRAMSGDTDASLEAVKNYYLSNAKAKDGLTAQVREEKTIEFLISHAKVAEVPAEELGK